MESKAYTVVGHLHHSGQRYEPAKEGEEPVTILLDEKSATIHLKHGNITDAERELEKLQKLAAAQRAAADKALKLAEAQALRAKDAQDKLEKAKAKK